MSESTSIRASREATIELRRLAGRLSAETGRPVSLGDALAAVVAAIGQDIDAVLGALPKHDPGERPSESYGERRPYVVADNLRNLHGPTGGVVRLPHHLNWSGNPTYNLDEPNVLRTMYKTVLSEANNVEDLNRWLDYGELVSLWRDLYLPPKVRRIWNDRFPELAAVSSAITA